MTQMNLSIKQKQTHRHREQICGYGAARGGQVGGRRKWERDELGAWGYQMQTMIYRMD